MQNNCLEAFVGIDVSFAKRKAIPLVICTKNGNKITPLTLKDKKYPPPPKGKGNLKAIQNGEATSFSEQVYEYIVAITEIENLVIKRIAIDAPKTFKAKGQIRRSCEVAMDNRKISCITTPNKREFENKIKMALNHISSGGPENCLPGANQFWMLIGFAIFRTLEKYFECIEVFPQAIVRELGCDGLHKSKESGWQDQLRAVAEQTGWSSFEELAKHLEMSSFGSRHDKLDAYMSAWVASLSPENRVACGNPPNDVIWIPKVQTR
jgi:predicted nuclease with RNAse H fold